MIERKSLFTGLVVVISIINLEAFSIGIEQLNFPKSVLLYITAGIGLGLIVGIRDFWKDPKSQQWPFFAGLFGISLVWAALNTDGNWHKILFGELNRMNGLLTWFSLMVIFILAIQSFQKSNFDFLFVGFMITAGIQALIGLSQLSDANAAGQKLSINPIQGTLGNPNFLSAFIALGALAGTYFLLNHKYSLGSRSLSALYVLGILTVVFKSDSQQGLIVYASGAVIVLWHLLNEKYHSKSLNFSYGLGLLGAGSLFVAGLFSFGPATTLVYQESVGLRIQYWTAAIEMFKNNLLTGVGISSYGDNFLLVRTIEQIELVGETTTSSNDAHNIFLQNAATGGLLLFLSYSALVIFVYFRAWIAYKQAENRLPVVILSAIWVGYTAQSLLSINQIGLAIWGWAIAGAIVGFSLNLPVKLKINSKLAIPAVAAGLILGLVVQVSNIAIQTQLRGIFTSNVSMMTPAEKSALIDELYRISENLPDPELGAFVATRLTEINQTAKAQSLLIGYAESFPNSALIQNQLADIFEAAGDYESALPYRQRSIQLDPINNDLKKKLAAYPVG